MLISATYEFTVLPMHMAKIAINHIILCEAHAIKAHGHSLLADPSTEVKLCFFAQGVRLRNLYLSQVWEFRLLLLECPCNDSPGSRIPGTGREIPYAPDARCNRRSPGGRARRTAVAADAGPRKACCAVRRR